MATVSKDVSAKPTNTGPAAWPLARQTLAAALFLPTIVGFLAFGPSMFTFPPVAVFLAVQLVLGGVLVWRANKWVALAGGIVLALFAGMNIVFIAPEMLRPDHGLIFLMAYTVIACGIAGLVAGISLFRASGRGAFAAPRWGAPGSVAVLLVAGLLLGVGVGGWAGTTLPASGAGTVALTPDQTVEVAISEFEFPETINVQAGAVVKLVVTNQDSELHTFSIDALGLAAEIPGGKTVDVWLTAEPGTYQVYCLPHAEKEGDSHTGMVGTLVAA